MGFFNFFVASLECPICHSINDDTEMDTYVEAELEYNYQSLGVGYHFKESINEKYLTQYYEKIQSPMKEPFRILLPWICPNCGYPYNWAQMEIANSTIISIKSTPLTKEVFNNAHYIHDECVGASAKLADIPINEIGLNGEDIVEILREKLTDTPFWRINSQDLYWDTVKPILKDALKAHGIKVPED